MTVGSHLVVHIPKKELSVLCDLIKVWIKGTYTASFIQTQINDFCTSVNIGAFTQLQPCANVRLTHADGTVCEEAYQAIPLLALNRLLGQEIALYGQTLQLCYTGKNQLISQPITVPRSHHPWKKDMVFLVHHVYHLHKCTKNDSLFYLKIRLTKEHQNSIL